MLIAQLFPTATPGVDRLDAAARASGNRKGIARSIGIRLFRTRWPAQVLTVYADGVANHTVAGLRINGRGFHHALTRVEFVDEIVSLVRETFAVSTVDEVDVWVSVPLRVGKDVVVAGDLARPSSRPVFTVSVLRSENAASLTRRIGSGSGVFWDQEWALTALK